MSRVRLDSVKPMLADTYFKRSLAMFAPDAEREGEHGDGGEPGVLQQLAEGEFQVIHEN